MRAAAVVGGVLGGGTAVVFALAFLVSALFPNGAMVSAGWNGAMMRGGPAMFGNDVVITQVDTGVPMPMPVEQVAPPPEK